MRFYRIDTELQDFAWRYNFPKLTELQNSIPSKKFAFYNLVDLAVREFQFNHGNTELLTFRFKSKTYRCSLTLRLSPFWCSSKGNQHPNNARMENRTDLNLGEVVFCHLYLLSQILNLFMECLWFTFLIAWHFCMVSRVYARQIVLLNLICETVSVKNLGRWSIIGQKKNR